jgi:hypothetical protein
MAKWEAALEFVGFIGFKFDLFLDIFYVLSTPMAYVWFKYIMWFTIIIPYVWMLLISCGSNKPVTVQCLTFFSIFLNQEHLILHAHAIDRWVKYSENQIIVIGMENITQFSL